MNLAFPFEIVSQGNQRFTVDERKPYFTEDCQLLNIEELKTQKTSLTCEKINCKPECCKTETHACEGQSLPSVVIS